MFMICLWGDTLGWQRIVWLCCGPLLGIGSEVAQLLEVVAGTFDYRDLLVTVNAAVLALIVAWRTERTNLMEASR
jgi:hypothetical protein